MDETLLSQCPACGLQLEVKLAWIGRSGTCKCGEKFYIEPSVALKEPSQETSADEQADASIHVVSSEDIFGGEDLSPEENLRRTIRLALKDGMVSIDEQILLENLRHEYGISAEAARQIFDEEKGDGAEEESTTEEVAVAGSPAEEESVEPESEETPQVDVAEENEEVEEEEATSRVSSLIWLAVGAAAAVGAYLYFSGVIKF